MSQSRQNKCIAIWVLLSLCLLQIVLAYINVAPGDAFWACLGLYFLIPLAAITQTPSRQKYIAIIGWIVATVIIWLGQFQSFGHWAAWLTILGVLYSIDQHKFIISMKHKITVRAIAYSHSMVFCMTFAISLSLALMGRWNTFTLTCDNVRETISTHLATITTPLRVTTAQMSQIQLGLDTFFTKSPNEVVEDRLQSEAVDYLNIPTTTGTNILSWLNINNQRIQNMIKSLGFTGYAEQANSQAQYAPTTASQNVTPEEEGTLSYYKHLLFDTPFGTKQDLDKKICGVVFDQVKEWYEKPGFRISIFLTLVLFFYPLMRLFMFIYTGITSLIYLLLKKIWFITIEQEQVIRDTWNI